MFHSDTQRRLTGMLKQLGIAALYALPAYLSHLYFDSKGIVSIFEPACGLALAILLIGGRQYAWGILLGALLVNVLSNSPFWVAVTIAVGNTVEALVAAWLLNRNGSFDLRLRSLRSYLLLILAGSVGGIICALAETMALQASGWQASETYAVTLAYRWMGEVLGVVLVTPLILVWWRTKRDWLEAKWISEAILLLGLTFLFGQIIFLGWFHDSIAHLDRGVWMFLLVTWVALRLGTRGAVIAVLMMAVHALWGAYHGIGYFANDIARTQLVNYWFYMFVLSVNGMALATYLAERDRSEAALRESEASTHAILDNLPYMIWLKDIEGRYIKANKRFLDSVRMGAPEQLIGKTDFDIWPAELAEKYHNDDLEVLASRQQKCIEEPALDGGRTLWVETFKTPVVDENGKVFGTAGFARDITGIKLAEETARASEIRMQEIIDVMPVVLFIKDPASNIILMNRACEAQWGMSFSDLRGTDASRFFPPEQMALFLARDREVFANRRLVDFEETAWSASRRENRIMHTYKKPVFDKAGNPLYLIGMSVDITERKQAEEVLKLHKLVIDTAINGFWMVDMKGNLREVNQAYAQMSGYSMAELLAMHISQLEAKEKSVQEVDAHIEKIIAQGYDRFETRHRRKDGQEIDIEVSVRFMPESQSFCSFLRDITERKRVERELRELNERLEERVGQRTQELTRAKQLAESANRVKSEFLANMSHEIRTPMNSILGMTHLALRAETNPNNRGYFKKIQSSGEHLLGIIDDLLNFAKIGAGKVKVETVDFDLSNVMERLDNMIAGKVMEKGLELAFDIDSSIPNNLRGDPLRLVQVLINYADNAIKFTEKGKIIIRARKISEHEESCLVRFEVQDTGIGMNDAEKARLFQPFQQADTSITRQYGGTGLGLAISKQLVGMMEEGRVGVDSTLGQGSAFWFSVRLGKSSMPHAAENTDETAVPQDILAALNGSRILVAENHLLNQEVVTEFLENAGAVVCVAQNGKEAIDLLQKEFFACVLMDLQMPVLDGFEATRLIRANPALAKIPVIAMTANASDEDRERCLAAGMDDFISKPFKPYALYATVARWLSAPPRQEPLPGTSATPVAGTTWTGDPDVIDLAVLAELVGDDKLKMREFALKFLASVRGDMKEIEAALERNDLAALGALGHHVKSPARMTGAIGFARLSQELENYGKSGGNVEQAQEIISQMHAVLDRINERIEKDLA